VTRSIGITASAVISFAGSALFILFGGFTVMTAIMARSRTGVPEVPNQPFPSLSPEIIFASIAALYVGFGVWGIISGVALLRLRNWARVCFVVFGGILSFFSFFGGLGVLSGMDDAANRAAAE
jgi:hypothetical protein